MAAANVDTGQSSQQAWAHNAEHVRDASHVHAVPPRLLLTVFGALMVLTVITVGVTLVDLGPLNVVVALAVALLKAGLVAMYFMHLRWDSPFNGIILIVALFFVTLFIAIAILDSKEYKVNYSKPSSGQVMTVRHGK
jgi:cytochrome c oxidase subunit 4